MTATIARMAVAVVTVAAVGAAVYRAATGPDRVKERRNLARSVCITSGGEWVKVDNNELCHKTEEVGKL